MTTIKWGGSSTGLTGPAGAEQTGLPAGVSFYVDGGRVRVGPTAASPDNGREDLSANAQARLLGSLADPLSGALSRLSERIEAVRWPQTGQGATGAPAARSVSVGRQAMGGLTAEVNPAGVSSLEERLAGRQRREGQASGLAAGTYALTLSLGEASERLEVAVGAGWSAGQVHDALARAVNGSSLAVEGQVLRNTSGLFAGRERLVLSADASLAGQAVGLVAADGASGALTRWLDLSAQRAAEAAGVPAGTGGLAAPGVTRAEVLSTAADTRYSGRGFDAEARATLAPGTYTLDYLLGPAGAAASDDPARSGSVSIQVTSGDTWGEVLARMARVLGSASPAMAARLVPARRGYVLPTGETGTAEAVGLEVTESSGKTGWRLSLSGADAASQGLLDAIGLADAVEPGREAVAVIDGRRRSSAGGSFSADSGRLTLGAAGVFGEAAPVRVTEGAQALADALGGVLTAYNAVVDLLQRNAGELRAGVVDGWTALAAGRAAELDAVGVARAGQSLWLDEERFLVALFSDSAGTRETLLGADGLLPALSLAVREGLDHGELGGVESWPTAEAGERSRERPSETASRALRVRSEAEVERANQLLDLYDAAPGLDFPDFSGRGTIVRGKG